MSSSQESAVRIQVLDIIAEHFGKATARLYRDFYEQQDLKTVMDSINELLEDYVGKEKTQEILSKLNCPIK